MVFSQLTHLPIIFQVDEDVCERLDHFLGRNRLSFQKILVVTGSSFSYGIGKRIVSGKDWDFFKLLDNSLGEVDRLKVFCNQNQTDLIIAVGGGKVLDV